MTPKSKEPSKYEICKASEHFVPFTVNLFRSVCLHGADRVGINGINANFAFPYIYSFLRYLDLRMLVNVKVDFIW